MWAGTSAGAASGWGAAEGTGQEERVFLHPAPWHFAHYPVTHPSVSHGVILLYCNKMKLHSGLVSSSSITEH